MNTELCQKMLLQVYSCELHIDTPKKYATGFSMEYNKKGIVYISDYDLQLIFPTQLRNITQRHQIMCGCKICIQAGTYQESLNH